MASKETKDMMTKDDIIDNKVFIVTYLVAAAAAAVVVVVNYCGVSPL